MARKLFIVKDDVFKNLPSRVADGTIAEVKRLFGFLANFTVSVLEPAGFPERLDFTDSIMKIVENDDDIDAVLDQARHVELNNVVFSARQNSVNMTTPPPQPRSTFDPDLAGRAFQQKEIVDPTRLGLIVTVTGGVASLQSAKQAVVEFATGGRTAKDIESSRNKKELWDRYWMSHQALIDVRDLATWDLMKKKGWSDWSNDLQDNVAVALGRIIAHEARHQYIVEHSSTGLGADGPRFFGDKNFQDFEKGDQSDITARLVALNRQQSAGRTHLDTIPKGRTFPFD